jgi:mono/diheme cytochrome c family protein
MPLPIWNRSSKPNPTPAARWKTIGFGVLLGWLSGGAALAVGATGFIALGMFDVAATTPQTDWTSWITHTTMIRSVKMRAGAPPRSQNLPRAQVERGSRLYESHCVACHGGPGISRADWTAGLNPTPPYLLDTAREWSSSQLHFIIANGVKMTAMPGWKLRFSDQDIWSVVAFVKALRGMSRAYYLRIGAALSHPERAAAPATPVATAAQKR